MARPDFRASAARRLAEERELSPAIISLLSPDSTRQRRGSGPIAARPHRAQPGPAPPHLRRGRRSRSWRRRSASTASCSPSSSARSADGRYQLIAGERRWRAASRRPRDDPGHRRGDRRRHGARDRHHREPPARGPLAARRSADVRAHDHEHGYSLRKLAQKLGKDKGYIENRLRLADAPPEVRELVSLRKDTLSHAYELLKVEDPRKRRRLAEQVARGELTLVQAARADRGPAAARRRPRPTSILRSRPQRSRTTTSATPVRGRRGRAARSGEDSLVTAKQRLAEALDELSRSSRSPTRCGSIADVDRAEPREVPDDRQAQARERDRRRPPRLNVDAARPRVGP